MAAIYSISAKQTELKEGNFGSTPFTFEVTRDSNALAETINYSVTGAVVGNDFEGGVVPTNLVLTFNPGETTKTITILVHGDQAFEASELFTVTLSDPSLSGSTIDTAAASSTILNDDQTFYSNVSFTLPTGAVSLELLGYDNIDGTGNAGNNFIRGNEGNNVLEGLGGDDQLFGGMGRDTASYAHALAGLDKDGNPTVGVTVDLSVTGYQFTGASTGSDRLNSIENLQGSDFNDTLTGNVGINYLYGGLGNDTLDGGAGADKLYGGIGDDKYIVDDVNDLVIENFNEGMDEVYSSVSYTLRPNLENLILTGTGNINGTGNSGNNFIRGNDFNNIIEGGGGNDNMYGGNGRDTVSYEHAVSGVTVSLSETGYQYTGGAGKDIVTGFENIRGSAFNDFLTGTLKDNVYTGGTGADQFIFVGGPPSQPSYADTITDFSGSAGEGDKLVFKNADYGFASGHTLAANELTLGSTAVGANVAQFVFNAANHTLYFDHDGQGGDAAIKVAVLTGVNSLSLSDFLLT